MSPSRTAWVRSLRVSRPVFGSVTPKQTLVSPEMSLGSMFWRCSFVANLATGCVAYTSVEYEKCWEVELRELTCVNGLCTCHAGTTSA